MELFDLSGELRVAALTLRPHRVDDLDALAVMNRALIDDQGSRNRMGLPALRRRFERLVAEGRLIDMFERDGAIVGFASHAEEEGQGDPPLPQVHLHQFFIDRAHRRNGFGREAFTLLATTRWRPGVRVVLHVLEANPVGQRFWASLGFTPYSVTMETFLPAEPAGA
jgi:GNAT superfamily N-acetyltransferase